MSALWTGLYAGLILGVPFGPVGVLALRYALQGAFAQVWALAVGTVLAEALIAVVVGMMIGARLPKAFAAHPVMRFAFAAILVLMGVSMIMRPLGQSSRRPGGLLLSLGQGAGVTIINPGIAGGYLAIVVSRGHATSEVTTLLNFAMGVVIASGAWWIAGVPILRKLVRLGKPEWMAALVRILGVVFVIAGLVVGIGTHLTLY
jgi:threonine/homoserine/homoserine lactone efflux protein